MFRYSAILYSASQDVTEEVTLALIKDQNTAIPARLNEDIWKLQMEDPSIGFVLHAKEANERPSSDILKGKSLINAVVVTIAAC